MSITRDIPKPIMRILLSPMIVVHKVVGLGMKMFKEAANSDGYLRLPTYNNPNDFQNTHPSVVHIPGGWNGYSYWMGVTPYESEDENLENPCILASNNVIDWEEPKAGMNPLFATPNKWDFHYSDTELVYNETLKTLELYFRKNTRENGVRIHEYIFRTESEDGIEWSQPIEVYRSLHTEDEAMSPVVIIDEGKYKMWLVAFTSKKIKYLESYDGLHWIFVRDISVPAFQEKKYVWHMDVKKTVNGYEMYYCAGENHRCYDMCYSISTDNVTYSNPVGVMKGSLGSFDERIYRPSFIDVEGRRYIFYGGVMYYKKWYIGMTTSTVRTPTVLRGV